MIPILIVTHTESKARDDVAYSDVMRGLQGPFHFQVCDYYDKSQVYSSNGGFASYDDARTAGVTAVDYVLKKEENN